MGGWLVWMFRLSANVSCCLNLGTILKPGSNSKLLKEGTFVELIHHSLKL